MKVGNIVGGAGGPGGDGGDGGAGGDVKVTVNNYEESLLKSLNPVIDAAYNTGARVHSKCLPDTRLEMIQEINLWADQPFDRRIAWLHGPAGFGKSAVARTLADQWDQSDCKRLIGSFCFFRTGDLSKASRLLPTLAYQLALSLPDTKPAIEDALSDDPLLPQKSVEQQFQKLIVDPIQVLPWPSHRMIIVIDGVDECDDLDLISQLMQAITSRDLSQFPVLFFFSSRMEGPIEIILNSPTNKAIVQQFSLIDFDADKDIQSFLKAKFTSAHDFFDSVHTGIMEGIPRPWPSPSDLDKIVRLVDGSFAFADALVSYVRDGNSPAKLEPILKEVTGVDGMYKKILSPLWRKSRFQTVFSTIMLLKKPFSIAGLGSLLQFETGGIIFDLCCVKSIVFVPGDNSGSTKVEIFHTSLRDFSTSLKRSEELCTDTAEKHLQLVMSCLQVMLPSEPEEGIPRTDEAIDYASDHWLEHLQLVFQRPSSLPVKWDSLMKELTGFASEAFDTWFTTMVLKWALEPKLDLLDQMIGEAKTKGVPGKVPKALEGLQELLKLDLKSLDECIYDEVALLDKKDVGFWEAQFTRVLANTADRLTGAYHGEEEFRRTMRRHRDDRLFRLFGEGARRRQGFKRLSLLVNHRFSFRISGEDNKRSDLALIPKERLFLDFVSIIKRIAGNLGGDTSITGLWSVGQGFERGQTCIREIRDVEFCDRSQSQIHEFSFLMARVSNKFWLELRVTDCF